MKPINIQEPQPIGSVGEGKKHHFFCVNCGITLYLNWHPKCCLWCGSPFLQEK